MNKYFNHSPFVCNVWVPFNGHRFKNPYMIRTKEGKEMLAIPNGGAWCNEQSQWIEEADVTHIKALPDGEGPRRSMSGGWRVARDIEYFGPHFPVWCGEKDGFVWEDELSEGKQILPVRIQAYRNKRSEEKKIILFITEGLVVDKDESIPTLESLQRYVDIPGFWIEEDVEFLSHNETIMSIHWAARFLDITARDSRAQEMIKFLAEVGMTPNKYLPLFGWYLTRWNNDEEALRRQIKQRMENDKSVGGHWGSAQTADESLSESDKQVIHNALRGPKNAQMLTLDILEASNFMKNPLIHPQTVHAFQPRY